MRATKATFLTVVLPLLAIFAAVFVVGFDQCAYAKGTRKSPASQNSRESASNNSKRESASDNSQRESASDNSRRESAANSSRRESAANSSRRENSSASRPESSSQSASRSTDSSRAPSVTRTEERRPDAVPGRSKSPQNSDAARPVRSEISSVLSNRTEVRASESPGSYRKDYADIGRIWRERQERRETKTQEWRQNYKKHDDHDVHVNINYFFPGRYRYYVYDYVPGYCYPSLYCYYYGLFPPYIPSYRIIYLHRTRIAPHLYIDLPITIIHRDYTYYDYYDSYYSAEWRYRSLASALRDIERAWDRGDVDLLMEHVRPSSQIHVSLKGEYAYSVDRQDYHEMTLDAMSNIRTVDFEFYRVRHRDNYEAVAYGKHTYYDEAYDRDDDSYGTRKTVYVSYTLERHGSDWYITEAGMSPLKLY